MSTGSIYAQPGEQPFGSTWPLQITVVNICGEKEWRRGVPTSSISCRDTLLLGWDSPAPRFGKWGLQWEQCGAQLCLQDFRDDIITPEAEQSGAPGRQRDVSSAIHRGQLIQHQHWAHCGVVQCTSLSFFCVGFFFPELLFEE